VSLAAERDQVRRDEKRPECLLRRFDKFSMISSTGTDKYHAVGGVVGLDIGCKVITLDGKSALHWAKNGATERLTCATVVINGVSGCDLDGGGIPW
jgi:hypothetical protein